jgi:hypothetical protein
MLPQAWRPALREPASSSARTTGRLNRRISHGTSVAPFFPQGGKAAKHHGAQASGQHQGKRVPWGHPRPPPAGTQGDQATRTPWHRGRISRACLHFSLNFYEHAPLSPGGQETRVPNGRRPGCRMARRPGRTEARRPGGPETRLPDGPEARRPGCRMDRRPGGIQIKTAIISNT